MKVDLFTLVAQIVNFLILVFLLRHFLYKRIIKTMDEREQDIASRYQEAEDKKKEAQEKEESLQKMKDEFRDKRQKMLEEVSREAEEKRRQLEEEKRKEVEELELKWKKSLNKQEEDFLAELRTRVKKEVFEIVRKVLQDMADKELEEAVIETFLRKVNGINDEVKKTLAEDIRQSGKETKIRSSFEIPDDYKRKIKKLIQDLSGKKIIPQFQEGGDFISGIELWSKGKKIAWTLNNYLHDLERHV
ncbi:MAG: hypothetical protein ACOC57_04115, partial [Acidobacteriota bacterium]